tara:strand:+ start:6448 stop:6642 length:195 start_codon:yes stop_codon:yes gene_type:complete
MSCESNENHDDSEYCNKCSTCHQCLREGEEKYGRDYKEMKAENERLREEIKDLGYEIMEMNERK